MHACGGTEHPVNVLVPHDFILYRIANLQQSNGGRPLRKAFTMDEQIQRDAMTARSLGLAKFRSL